MKAFKSAGYQVHLIFISVNMVEECVQRVSIRVKAGGHKVPEDTIIYNFKAGYANLCTYFKEFDSVTLYDNAIPQDNLMRIPQKVLYMEKGKILFTTHSPLWVQQFVKIVKKK